MRQLHARAALAALVALVPALPAIAADPAGSEVNTTKSIIFDDDGQLFHVFPLRPAQGAINEAGPSNQAAGQNLRYHGGPVMVKAAEKSLWWGAPFDSDVQPHVSQFFAQFGTSQEYVPITQYYNSAGQKIQTVNLGGLNYYDSSQPPTTVTDADCRNEIIRNFQNGNLGTPAANTVYFLFLPNGVTSTSGGSSSCVNYCGYHSNFSYNGIRVKYAVMPYPSCGGCQGDPQSGLSIEAASLTIVSGHEMREAATDPLGSSWYDIFGQEADDKCAWILFVDNGFQYQKEWSNAVSGCVMKGINGP